MLVDEQPRLKADTIHNSLVLGDPQVQVRDEPEQPIGRGKHRFAGAIQLAPLGNRAAEVEVLLYAVNGRSLDGTIAGTCNHEDDRNNGDGAVLPLGTWADFVGCSRAAALTDIRP